MFSLFFHESPQQVTRMDAVSQISNSSWGVIVQFARHRLWFFTNCKIEIARKKNVHVSFETRQILQGHSANS